jgi:hypothetical protein
MTIQSSGAIYLSDIQTEFGGSNPIYINEYYGKDSVPSSGPITMADFYGTSDSYSVVGQAVADTYTFIAGSTINDASVLSRVTDGNINSYIGVHGTSVGGWPTDLRLRSEAIKTAVQAKLGTSTPTAADFDYINTTSVGFTGWIEAASIGTINATLDGSAAIYMLNEANSVLAVASIQDNNVDDYDHNGSLWQWCPFGTSIVSNGHPINNNMDLIAEWIHGGCNVRVTRGTGVYTDIADISDVVYNLDFAVS